jgi:hypothetical protein
MANPGLIRLYMVGLSRLRMRVALRGEQLAQKRTRTALEQTIEARRSRLLSSSAEISPTERDFRVINADPGHDAPVRIRRAAPMGTALVIFSTAICLMLLVNEPPLAAARVSVTPAGFRQITLD